MPIDVTLDSDFVVGSRFVLEMNGQLLSGRVSSVDGKTVTVNIGGTPEVFPLAFLRRAATVVSRSEGWR